MINQHSFPEFHKAQVLVIGDIMLDRYWHGGTSRISPEAPVPVVHIGNNEERPGGAANVALNIATLGAHVSLIGMTGADEAADKLQQRLKPLGVDCFFHQIKDADTITKLRVISRQQQLIRLDFEKDFAGCDTAPMMELFEQQLNLCDVVVLSDYGKGTLKDAQNIIALARKAGKKVLVDPKGSDFERYRNASFITPNLSEFEAVVGPCREDDCIQAKASALSQQLGLDGLLVTRSERGMSLITATNKFFHLPTHAREVYDVTGAGDTVISVLAAALASGSSLEHAIFLSNVAAGVVVGKLGTAAITESELRLALKADQEHDQGVIDEDRLVAAIADARARGEKIVFTNGCFDLMHAGHVSYLEHARHLGDRLIVAVNSDESVKILKGNKRPINPLDQRMAVLAGLASVDWVVPFGEETPERLICRLVPDVLVKGGDYRPQDIAGYDCVTENGGRVEVLPFVEGCSSSSMIERILQAYQKD